MRVKLGLTLLGLLSACSLAAVGCGADDDDDATGGKGGAGGGAGSSGKGGAAGKGGTAGSSTAGEGPVAGRGGTGGSGGSSGESGAGGQAGGGEGGAVGGAGAAAGESGAGGAGAVAGEGGAGGATHEAGAGGAGGDAPVETATFCSYGCETTADCATSGPTEYECHPTRQRCEDPGVSCDVSSDCLAFASFWFLTCTSSDDCTPAEECVAVGGRGYCAFVAVDGSCSFPPTVVSAPRFVDGTPVDVCGSDTGFCDPNHTCQMGCATNDDCTAELGAGSVCNTTTHECGCTASTECTGPGVSVCNPATERCECAGDDDCALVPNRPRCVSGVCGCSDASADCSVSPFVGAAEATCR
jgi:hypothetical protein